MTTPTCASCGSADLEMGVIVEAGDGARRATWLPGKPEFGPLGGLRVFGRARRHIDAKGCRECGYLNLFVGDDA
jgi:hypothetical protein